MKNTLPVSVIVASLFVLPSLARSEDTGTNPVKHPVVAYDEHQVKTNEKDVQKDATKITETKMSMEERKGFVDTQKADYEQALKQYGSDHDITKQSKDRYEDAQKSYDKSARLHNKAHKAMRKDQQELQHAQKELKEDKTQN